jgi:hypothetical protein
MNEYENMNFYQLVALRTTLLRGVVSPYSTAEEREAWQSQVAAITEELARQNESKP